MKRLVVIAVCIVVAGLLWVQADPNQNLAENPDGGFAQPAQWVKVTNWPDPQSVAGAVAVTNLPVEQLVTGTVNVGNLPPVLQVEVTNLPIHIQQFRFVGVTSSTFPGDGTRAAMNEACASEYPGSRMASADEYTTSPSPPAIAGFAWVEYRAVVAVLTNDPNANTIFIDPAGTLFRITNPGADKLSCSQWTQSSGSGAVVRSDGSIAFAGCSQELPVACSGPQ